MAAGKFTGYKRSHKNRTSVVLGEKIMKGIISVGGIGVIAAVFLVFVFLVSVVIPLFKGSDINIAQKVSLSKSIDPARSFMEAGEFRVAAFVSGNNGRTLSSLRLDTGEVLETREVFDREPVSLSFSHGDGWITAGFEDGTTRIGQIQFKTVYLEEEMVDPSLRSLEVGEIGVFNNSVVERTPVGQMRIQQLEIHIDDPVYTGNSSPVTHIDKTVRSSGPIMATLAADGEFRISSVSRRRNILTGVTTTSLSGGAMDISDYLLDHGVPLKILINALGDAAYVIWADGYYIRIDGRNIDSLFVTEDGFLLEEGEGTRLTSVEYLLGRGTILAGDSLGRIRTWFPVRDENAGTADQLRLANAHTFEGPAPVRAIASSSRKRLISAGYEDGSAALFYVTSIRLLAREQLIEGGAIRSIALGPKDDAVLVLGDNKLGLYHFEAPHPEGSFKAIFGKVWYEGNPEPEHSWQSSSGTDTFEAKYGLIPLIFGTLKATFYSMFFGIPIAILAAIYTSEFMKPSLRAKIKPTIEMMASLPSVVLGFLAALVFAPFVENIVPAVLAAFIIIPLSFPLGGYLYQLLPRRTAIIFERYRLLLIVVVLIPLALLASAGFGSVMERLLFDGDIKMWLDGQIGDGSSGWILMFLPLSAIGAAWLSSRYLNPRLRVLYRSMEHTGVALAELVKFIALALCSLLIAVILAKLLGFAGLDSRMTFPVIGSLLGTYIQRNSLIVGFIMGFAIIPIIYTISDDALTSVPEHLRSASLASGATKWQTTVRIIIPTAMSGLFSAVMIGLGRAVGETMIVLMATGNTPIMEWNIFNGFRTLAANIAVELPEAVVDSTHYRILFLAALTLFIMTFTVNTVAEVIRQRFRKRAFEL
jgi:phosphate transport system permease protein